MSLTGKKAHEFIARKRRMVGLTQHELARQSNLSVSRLVWFETGRCDLEPEELGRIKDALKRACGKCNGRARGGGTSEEGERVSAWDQA